MKPTRISTLAALAMGSMLLIGCAQEDRTARVERRQDRMDARTYGRQERQQVRADREDARAAARFNSW